MRVINVIGAEVLPALDGPGGLPLHPLVVHAPIVLLPLAALGSVIMVARARFNKRFGVVFVIAAWAGALSTFLARQTGEELARTVPVLAEHVNDGGRLPFLALGFALTITVFWLFDRGIPGNRPRPWWLWVLAVILVILAVVVVAATIGTGHSGAESVWGAN
ncbi:MAG: hypothetical protein RJB01_1604 [Actinomycetota bacterium]|jgi:uncharacterized membrane protein